MRNLFFVILFSLSLITTEAQETQFVTTQDKTTNMESEQHELAIISLKFTKSEKQYSVTLTNSTILNSTKNIPESPKEWNENDFVCFVLNEQKQILDTIVIRQPLKVRYEFPTDDKTIGTTTMDLKENEILLRFKYSAKMKFLSVAKAGENKKLETLNTLILPQKK